MMGLTDLTKPGLAHSLNNEKQSEKMRLLLKSRERAPSLSNTPCLIATP